MRVSVLNNKRIEQINSFMSKIVNNVLETERLQVERILKVGGALQFFVKIQGKEGPHAIGPSR